MSTRTHAHEPDHTLSAPSTTVPTRLEAAMRALPAVLGTLLVVAAVVALAAAVPAVAHLLGVALVAVVFATVAALPVAVVDAVAADL